MPAKPQIIADPQTNRGTAFTLDERKRFGLMGRLPAAVETSLSIFLCMGVRGRG